MKPLPRPSTDTNPTIIAMREVRPGAYRIVNGIVLEDGAEIEEAPHTPRVSGIRKRADK